jgi:hypothetical protein
MYPPLSILRLAIITTNKPLAAVHARVPQCNWDADVKFGIIIISRGGGTPDFKGQKSSSSVGKRISQEKDAVCWVSRHES